MYLKCIFSVAGWVLLRTQAAFPHGCSIPCGERSAHLTIIWVAAYLVARTVRMPRQGQTLISSSSQQCYSIRRIIEVKIGDTVAWEKQRLTTCSVLRLTGQRKLRRVQDGCRDVRLQGVDSTDQRNRVDDGIDHAWFAAIVSVSDLMTLDSEKVKVAG